MTKASSRGDVKDRYNESDFEFVTNGKFRVFRIAADILKSAILN